MDLREHLKSQLNESRLSKADAKALAKDYLKNADDMDSEANYETAYGMLQDIAYDCSDAKCKKVALAALDTDEDDMYDRLGTFTDALEEIATM